MRSNARGCKKFLTLHVGGPSEISQTDSHTSHPFIISAHQSKLTALSMNRFFDQGSMIGYAGYCSNNGTQSSNGGFGDTVDGLLRDLYLATPRMEGYFGASKRGGVYGVAQCARTVSSSVCVECLKVAYGSLKGCPPAADGRSADAGCFMRYSTRAFFSDDKATDLTPFLSSGEFILNAFKMHYLLGIVLEQ